MSRALGGGQLRLLLLSTLAFLASTLTAGPAVRVLFLTDCSPYSDWQSIAMVYSYMYSGHNGPITRVMCCSEEDRKTYSPEMLGLVETHIAASYVFIPRTGDAYLAYNKPGAVIDYLEHVTPEEEWLLVLDSDMLIRTPWRVQDFNLSLGWASGSEYGYLKGVHNELADRHIPEIPKRNDTFAGPPGRRSDMVGGFFFIHRTDLKRLSKLWLKYTEDVRADPEVRRPGSDACVPEPRH
jgi:peptidyl serine alpha-galactosyltransferase